MPGEKRGLSGKRVRLGIVFVMISILAAAFLLYFLPFPDERAQAHRAVSGAYEVIAGLGQFVSEDGTTASLPEEEIRREIREFDEKADRCYAEEFSAREYYKWLNRDYLTRTYKSTVDYIVKCGLYRKIRRGGCAYAFYFLQSGQESDEASGRADRLESQDYGIGRNVSDILRL